MCKKETRAAMQRALLSGIWSSYHHDNYTWSKDIYSTCMLTLIIKFINFMNLTLNSSVTHLLGRKCCSSCEIKECWERRSVGVPIKIARTRAVCVCGRDSSCCNRNPINPNNSWTMSAPAWDACCVRTCECAYPSATLEFRVPFALPSGRHARNTLQTLYIKYASWANFRVSLTWEMTNRASSDDCVIAWKTPCCLRVLSRHATPVRVACVAK